MPGSRIDVVSPADVGEDKVVLKVDPRSRLLVNHAVTILCDYARADAAGGVSAPLVFTVQPEFGDGTGFEQRTFSRRPATVSFVVEYGGSYLLTLREAAHNKWQGRLRVEVLGERMREQRRAVPDFTSSVTAGRFLSDDLLIASDTERMVSG